MNNGVVSSVGTLLTIISLLGGEGLVIAETFSPERMFSIEFGTGAVWQSRNEIHIPESAEGTRFSLADLQGSAPNVQRRVEATWIKAPTFPWLVLPHRLNRPGVRRGLGQWMTGWHSVRGTD